ncbi:MAG TPA: hypothetical protein PKD03_01635 [Ignavibacteriaceae bacterium]|mgnify:CR=1 FL=1|nr:hypothetical protein [Ignavibacteriaceae bacterium]
MNELLEQTSEMRTDFENVMSAKIKNFLKVADSFDEFLPEVKTKKIEENEKRILNETSSLLDNYQTKIREKESEVLKRLTDIVSPKRSSGIASEMTAGESQFQSALNLINTKNKALIKAELEKSLPNRNRDDFNFAIWEVLKYSDLGKDFHDEVIQMFSNYTGVQDYALVNEALDEIKEIKTQISYHRSAIRSGKLNNNYQVNRSIKNNLKIKKQS